MFDGVHHFYDKNYLYSSRKNTKLSRVPSTAWLAGFQLGSETSCPISNHDFI